MSCASQGFFIDNWVRFHCCAERRRCEEDWCSSLCDSREARTEKHRGRLWMAPILFATIHNERATALATDFFTSYVSSYLVYVHPIALSVNDFFKSESRERKSLTKSTKQCRTFSNTQMPTCCFSQSRQAPESHRTGYITLTKTLQRVGICVLWHAQTHRSKRQDISCCFPAQQSPIVGTDHDQWARKYSCEVRHCLVWGLQSCMPAWGKQEETLPFAPRIYWELHGSILYIASELVSKNTSFYDT